MQLLLGLKNTWKCIDVELEDGCTPRIGGVALKDCNIEPASWFKVSQLASAVIAVSSLGSGYPRLGSEGLSYAGVTGA